MNNYHAQGSDIQFIHSLVMTFPKPKCILQLLTDVSITHAFQQGGRSCAGARVAPAEKFGLGRTF